jgi:transposase
LGSVVSDVFGKSGRQVLAQIAQGVCDATTLILQITTKIRKKEEARKALTNCLTKEHCFLIKELLNQLRTLEESIQRVEGELSEKARPYIHLTEKLKEIPGISDILALGILAEATNQVENFPDERNFAAWAGVAAGNKESAGKKKEQNVDQGIPTYEKF